MGVVTAEGRPLSLQHLDQLLKATEKENARKEKVVRNSGKKLFENKTHGVWQLLTTHAFDFDFQPMEKVPKLRLPTMAWSPSDVLITWRRPGHTASSWSHGPREPPTTARQLQHHPDSIRNVTLNGTVEDTQP